MSDESDVFDDDDTPDDSMADELADDVEERQAAIEAEMYAARERIAEVPAEVVVLNHAMGLYELAAIHLSAQPARLGESALAIDAFACLVEGLGERIGPEIATLRDALSQIRIAFVQIKSQADSVAG